MTLATESPCSPTLHAFYAERRAQSRAVKRALIDAGLPAKSVRWGTGSSLLWLSVTLAKDVTHAMMEEAREIARVTLGRKKDTTDANNETDHHTMVSVSREF